MLEENKKAVEFFLNTKKGCSPSTQRHYSSRLKILSEYLTKKKISINKFNQDNLIDFLGTGYKHYDVKTMNHIKAVVSAFIREYFAKDYFSKFPNLANVCRGQKVMAKYSANQMLSIEEVQKLIQAEKDPRWKLIFGMQFYGGCRPSEICQLKWNDVTIAEDGVYFSIYSAKNNKKFEKFVPIEFSNYMKELQKTSRSEYCFTGTDGVSHLRHNVFYLHLVRLGKKVFPDKHINPYLLRHSIATILYGRAEKGEIDSDVVARQMGHSKNMKNTYVHFDIQTLRDNAKKIYIKPDLYTAKQKKEYEERIKELEEKQEFMNKMFKAFANKYKMSIEEEDENGKIVSFPLHD